MTRWGYDEPNGIIVGGNTAQIGWKIFYDGRCQEDSFNRHYSETEYQAEKEGKIFIESLKAEFKGICYGDDRLWEIRIYNDNKKL